MKRAEFQKLFSQLTQFSSNRFHALVWLHGKPLIGKNVSIGAFSEINAKGANVKIGNNCDIASFVAINCADSHKRCIGKGKVINRRDIVLENNVFVGSHSFIKGGASIGHHSVVAAGTIVEGRRVPPYSMIYGNPMKIKKGYYR